MSNDIQVPGSEVKVPINNISINHEMLEDFKIFFTEKTWLEISKVFKDAENFCRTEHMNLLHAQVSRDAPHSRTFYSTVLRHLTRNLNKGNGPEKCAYEALQIMSEYSDKYSFSELTDISNIIPKFINQLLEQNCSIGITQAEELFINDNIQGIVPTNTGRKLRAARQIMIFSRIIRDYLNTNYLNNTDQLKSLILLVNGNKDDPLIKEFLKKYNA